MNDVHGRGGVEKLVGQCNLNDLGSRLVNTVTITDAGLVLLSATSMEIACSILLLLIPLNQQAIGRSLGASA